MPEFRQPNSTSNISRCATIPQLPHATGARCHYPMPEGHRVWQVLKVGQVNHMVGECPKFWVL